MSSAGSSLQIAYETTKVLTLKRGKSGTGIWIFIVVMGGISIQFFIEFALQVTCYIYSTCPKPHGGDFLSTGFAALLFLYVMLKHLLKEVLLDENFKIFKDCGIIMHNGKFFARSNDIKSVQVVENKTSDAEDYGISLFMKDGTEKIMDERGNNEHICFLANKIATTIKVPVGNSKKKRRIFDDIDISVDF